MGRYNLSGLVRVLSNTNTSKQQLAGERGGRVPSPPKRLEHDSFVHFQALVGREQKHQRNMARLNRYSLHWGTNEKRPVSVQAGLCPGNAIA